MPYLQLEVKVLPVDLVLGVSPDPDLIRPEGGTQPGKGVGVYLSKTEGYGSRLNVDRGVEPDDGGLLRVEVEEEEGGGRLGKSVGEVDGGLLDGWVRGRVLEVQVSQSAPCWE